MKININEDNNFDEDEVSVIINGKCKYKEKIINYISSLDKKIIGMKDNQKYFINACDVLYVESVDKKTLYIQMQMFMKLIINYMR